MQIKTMTDSPNQTEKDTYQRIRHIDKKIDELKEQENEKELYPETINRLKAENNAKDVIIFKLLDMVKSNYDNKMSGFTYSVFNLCNILIALLIREAYHDTIYGILLILILLSISATLYRNPKARLNDIKSFIPKRLKIKKTR